MKFQIAAIALITVASYCWYKLILGFSFWPFAKCELCHTFAMKYKMTKHEIISGSCSETARFGEYYTCKACAQKSRSGSACG